jgi:hypothetical protein
VVEVGVAHKQVAHTLERDACGLKLPEQHGAAGGVDKRHLAAFQRNREARLRPLPVQRVAGSEEDHTPHAMFLSSLH